jgi:hypothetical protein
MDKAPKAKPNREAFLPTHPSYRKHRRDVIRQILLPMILVTLVGVGLAALSIYGAVFNHAGVSLWADISLIWLIIPMMFLALVILVLVSGMVYGLAKLLGAAPRYTGLAQHYALWLNTQIVLWTEKIIQPVLSLKAWLGIFSNKPAGAKREE